MARYYTFDDRDLAIILAAQYQCPTRIPEATSVMVDALNRLASTS